MSGKRKTRDADLRDHMGERILRTVHRGYLPSGFRRSNGGDTVESNSGWVLDSRGHPQRRHNSAMCYLRKDAPL